MKTSVMKKMSPKFLYIPQGNTTNGEFPLKGIRFLVATKRRRFMVSVAIHY